MTDMVCFSHLKIYYIAFQRLTRYPEFIGNCPGGCRYHFHPNEIFWAMNKGRQPTDEHLVFYDRFLEAIEIMKFETVSFFTEHLQDIDGESFWTKCKNEFPY